MTENDEAQFREREQRESLSQLSFPRVSELEITPWEMTQRALKKASEDLSEMRRQDEAKRKQSFYRAPVKFILDGASPLDQDAKEIFV